MRNGNDGALACVVDFLATFYPTYEEWKRGLSGEHKVHLIAFYPTYEEWKHT